MKKYSVVLLNALPDKKIKSIGNKCMIPIGAKSNILDYHIYCIKKIFHNPEIVLVCGFDSKKIKKFVATKYKQIKYIDHDIDEYTNIGHSIHTGLSQITGKHCLLLNTNHIIYSTAISKIKANTHRDSFLCYSNIKGDVGFILDSNYISNCYYGLPKKIYDICYIDNNQINTLLSFDQISKLYFFETINLCIDSGLRIMPLELSQKNVSVINTLQNIERLKKHICLI